MKVPINNDSSNDIEVVAAWAWHLTAKYFAIKDNYLNFGPEFWDGEEQWRERPGQPYLGSSLFLWHCCRWPQPLLIRHALKT
jgi:hypothetical protein